MEIKKMNESREIETCCICLETMTDILKLSCNHRFHNRCITEFCRKNYDFYNFMFKCPLCRKPFEIIAIYQFDFLEPLEYQIQIIKITHEYVLLMTENICLINVKNLPSFEKGYYLQLPVKNENPFLQQLAGKFVKLITNENPIDFYTNLCATYTDTNICKREILCDKIISYGKNKGNMCDRINCRYHLDKKRRKLVHYK